MEKVENYRDQNSIEVQNEMHALDSVLNARSKNLSVPAASINRAYLTPIDLDEDFHIYGSVRGLAQSRKICLKTLGITESEARIIAVEITSHVISGNVQDPCNRVAFMYDEKNIKGGPHLERNESRSYRNTSRRMNWAGVALPKLKRNIEERIKNIDLLGGLV